MNNLKFILTSLLGLVALNVRPALGAPLTQAELTRVYHEVSMVDPGAGKRPAVVHDVVKGNLAVETGLESRAELLFPDNTLTRLASNTYFSFKTGTREMDLGHGAILFQIPKGVGGAKINTAAITAAITGTTGFIERVGNTFKLVLLEGTVRVYLNDRVRESMMVHGGQMLIAPSNAHSMKDWSTVDFDVAKMMKTSVLLKPGLFKPLPPAAMNLISEVITTQGGKVAGGELNPTNLVIAGGVSTVLLVDNNTRDRFSDPPPKQPRAHTTPTPSPTATPLPTPTPSATATPTATPGPSVHASPVVIASPNPFILTRHAPSQITTGGAIPTISSNGTNGQGTIYGGGAQDGSASQFLFGSTSAFDLASNFDSTFGQGNQNSFAPSGVAVFKFSALRLFEPATPINTAGGPIDLALVATTSITDGGAATVYWDMGGLRSMSLLSEDGPIALTSAAFGDTAGTLKYLQFYARGLNGSISLGPINTPGADLYADADAGMTLTNKTISVANAHLATGADVVLAGTINALPPAGGTVSVDAGGTVTLEKTIQVSTSAGLTPSTSGGKVRIESRKLTGTAIALTNSSQILSLLNASAAGPGGTVTLKSLGGDILLTNAKIQADRGTIDVQNTGTNGLIRLSNSTMSADVVKVGALGDNGQLIIGGGTINANTLLKLYAGGSNGTVDFVSNVSLNGNSTKIISGNTVQIEHGVLVTIGGSNPAQVFTNNPNYTGSGGVGNGFGSFGGAGATTHSLGGGPGY